MSVNLAVSLLGVGLSLNAGLLAYMVRIEHRLTKIETNVENIKEHL